jgi:hypothetical protein
VPPIVGKHNHDVLTPEPLPQQRALNVVGGEGFVTPLLISAKSRVSTACIAEYNALARPRISRVSRGDSRWRRVST